MSVTREFIPSTGNLDGYVNHTAGVIWNADNWVFIGYNDTIDNDDCDAYYTFDKFSVPQYANIEEAVLKISVYAVNNGAVTTDFRIDLGNLTAITSYSDFTNLTLSDSFVDYTFDTSASEVFIYLDVTEIIQEKVNNENYVQGNNITFATSNTQIAVSNAYVDGDTYEYNLGNSITVTYTPQPVPDFRETFYNNRIESFQYELLTLNADQTNYIHSKWLTTVKNASITQNYDNDISGTATFEIEEDEDINYLTDLIKPYYTCNDYQFPLGCYMLLSPQKTSNGNIVTRNISGYNLLKALDDDKIESSVTIESGTIVTEEIIDYIESVGSWAKYNIEPNTETLSEDMTYEIGKSKLFIINSLLNTINYYPLFCSGNGTFISYPWTDELTSSWTFYDNNQSLYTQDVDSNIDYSSIYNKVVIVSNELEEDTAPITSVLTFEDIDLSNHPYSYTNLARYITKIFNSETVTQDYADLRANRELLKMLEIEENIYYRHAFISSRIDDGLFYPSDCFKFRNEKLEIESIYTFTNTTWLLKTGNLMLSTINRIVGVE